MFKYIFALTLIIFIWYVMQPDRIIYFDNAATTHIYPEVKREMNNAAYYGNPSAYYSEDARMCVDKLKQEILKQLNMPYHKCIITSGASESNNLLFRGFSGIDYINDDEAKFKYINIVPPRVLISGFEHKTSIECPGTSIIHIGEIGALNEIRRGDLVSIMHMNNETGDIIDIDMIQRICLERGAWFHTDASQSFGKIPPQFADSSNCCVSISFHKMHGPVGIGALIIPKTFPLRGQISGTQNGGLRGGTESAMLCAGALCAMEITFTQRIMKNEHLHMIRRKFYTILERYRPRRPIGDFMNISDEEAYIRAINGPQCIVYLDGLLPLSRGTINTVLVSFVNNNPGSRMCNIRMREQLTKRGVMVSIGSACNTSVHGASHVLKYMRLPFIIRCGVIRFSFSDMTTVYDLEQFEERCRDILKN